MIVRGLLFDINGTLIDIYTNEGSNELYRMVSNLLSYQGIFLNPAELRDQYYRIMSHQRKDSGEAYPEFDAPAIFEEILTRHATDYTLSLPPEKRVQLPLILAEAYRAASLFRIQLYPDVAEVLTHLRSRYRMAAVSDGQSAYARAEMHTAGLDGFFDPVIVSGDLGYRKPDRRIFEQALSAMAMEPDEVLFIGNDMYRDVYGAQQAGMKTVFFKSNQGEQEKDGVSPDYIIYRISELPNAIRFFEERPGRPVPEKTNAPKPPLNQNLTVP